MISLDQICQQVGRDPPGNVEPGPPVSAETAAGAAGDLEQALTFAGLVPEEVRALVLVGLADTAFLETAFAALPALERVLICEPERRNLLPLLGRALALGWGSVDPTRCFLAEPAGTQDRPNDGPAAADFYLDLFQFFRAARVGPGLALVREDPALATPAHREVAGVVRDFCSGFSSAFFSGLPGPAAAPAAPIPRALLRGIADLLYKEQDRYHALKFYRHLYRQAPEPEVAWRILECWSDLGCFDQVGSWLQEPVFPDAFRDQLRGQIDAALTDQRAAREDTYAANRAALLEHFPDCAARLPARPDPDSTATVAVTVATLPPIPWLLTYDAGEPGVERLPYPLLVRVEDDRLTEINPPCEPGRLHRAMSPPEGRDASHGCVNGWVVHSAAAQVLLCTDLAAAAPGWHRVINLIEPDLRLLSLLLQAADLSDRLVADRVHLFVGPDAEGQLLDHLRREANHPIPGIWFGVDAGLEAQLAEVQRRRDARVVDNVEALQERYPPARAQRILDAIEGRERRPLRALFLTSRYTSVVQYIAADFAATFRALGHEARVVREARSGQELSFDFVTTEIRAFDPDLVFLTNHTRPEYGRILPPGLPVVTWIQDEMPRLADPDFIAALGSLDLTYGYSTTVQARYQRLGYPFVGHLPFAVTEGVSPVPARSQAQVVFATHLEEIREPASCPGLADWLERRLAPEARIPIGTPLIDPLVSEACDALGYRLGAEARHGVLFWAAMFARRLDRLRVADAVVAAGFSLALYGRGWDGVSRFRRFARGVVAPGEPLRQVMRENKVVLHINGECNLHPRVLEGFCAGGFVLGRHEASDDLPGETGDQLALGREFCLYRNDEEMATLVSRAFTDEGWRHGVIEAAQARIRSDHTYASRARVVLGDLAERLKSRTSHGRASR